MVSRKAYDIPTNVTPIDGEVVLDGPDGVGVSMTPDAAEETARRLQQAARAARRHVSRRRSPPTATS